MCDTTVWTVNLIHLGQYVLVQTGCKIPACCGWTYHWLMIENTEACWQSTDSGNAARVNRPMLEIMDPKRAENPGSARTTMQWRQLNCNVQTFTDKQLYTNIKYISEFIKFTILFGVKNILGYLTYRCMPWHTLHNFCRSCVTLWSL